MYIILLGVAVLALLGYSHDLNRIADANSETMDDEEDGITGYYGIDSSLFVGTVLSIPKEIYYQDWVYVQDADSRVYQKGDVILLYTNHSAGTVLIRFPYPLDDGYLYYGYEANISNDWWQPHFNSRRNITFVQTILDDFTTTNETSVWV